MSKQVETQERTREHTREHSHENPREHPQERMREYQMKEDQRSHIYDIPDTYIGAIQNGHDRETFLFDLETKKYYNAIVDYPEPIERLFLEGLSNAGNNADETRRDGKDPGSIWIWVTDKEVCIQNDGNIIPIEYNKHHPELLNPEMIFGKLMTSSNYDTSVVRMGCGRNGFGAKLINIFSDKFWVNIKNARQGKSYSGLWRKNMKKHSLNLVEEYSGNESYVEINWRLDFDRFGIEKYTYPIIQSFARYAVDFSFTCKVPIYFNDVKLDASGLEEFASYLLPNVQDSLCWYQWEPEFAPKNKDGVTAKSAINYKHHIATVELILINTPYEGVIHSYVNGLVTVDGGSHVDSVTKEVYKHICDEFNSKHAKNNHKITIKEVKNHISMVLNCRLPNPTYTSQTKTKLQSPNIKIKLPDKYYAKMSKWSFLDAIFSTMEAKMEAELAKTDGRKNGRVSSDHGEDANFAGKKPELCDFYIVEGGSAAAYYHKRRDDINGKDYNGYCCLRGKPLNVRNASFAQLHNNKEIARIKKFLGLCEGVDYTIESNRKQLRYGRIIICTDADTDGIHICGVLLNFLEHRFPSILEIGMVCRLEIPVIKVYDTKDRIIKRYYSIQDYDKEADLYKSKKYYVQYFKGLATSSPEDVKDDITNASIIQFNCDDEYATTIKQAFDKNYSDTRKRWVEQFNPHKSSILEDCGVYQITLKKRGKESVIDIPLKAQNITDFIMHEGMTFTMDNLIRAIPHIWDGLKESQRKILFTALVAWKAKDKDNMRMKVSQFASKTATETAYGHGETSLVDAIMKMTANYVGSNNLPYFEAKGLFACRDNCGNKKDIPAGRYPNIRLAKWCKIAYPWELIDLVPRKVEEGHIIEPEYLPCIIPMHLINGSHGIGTAWSSTIVNHSINDCVEWIRARNANEPLPTIHQHFNGFTGPLEIVTKSKDLDLLGEADVESNSEEKAEDEELTHINLDQYKETRGKSLRTSGIYNLELGDGDHNTITITEIPIGISLKKYKSFLNNLVKEKQLKSFDDQSTSEMPRYILTDLKLTKKNISLVNLGLTRTFTLSNMTLIDNFGHPYHFTDANEIMESYYQNMIELFERLHQRRIATIKEDIQKLMLKLKFVRMVTSRELEIFHRPEEDIIADLSKLEIPLEVYQETKAPEFNPKKIDKLSQNISDLETELSTQINTSPQDIWNGMLDKLVRVI